MTAQTTLGNVRQGVAFQFEQGGPVFVRCRGGFRLGRGGPLFRTIPKTQPVFLYNV